MAMRIGRIGRALLRPVVSRNEIRSQAGLNSLFRLSKLAALSSPLLPRAPLSTTAVRKTDAVKQKVTPTFELTPEGLKVSGLPLPRLGTEAKRDVFPYVWLRDNCRCAACISRSTMQRVVKSGRIHRNIRPVSAVYLGEHPDEYFSRGVRITWPAPPGSTAEHTGFYPLDFFSYYSCFDNGRQGDGNVRPVFWPSTGPTGTEHIIQYESVMSKESAVRRMLDAIRRVGMVFVQGTPYDDPAATQRLLERIAFIRVTHYGGFYDFKPNLAMKDMAYTNVALGAHTDTTYFSDPAGLQAFHLLSHEPAPGTGGAGEDAANMGGKSLLIDGFRAAHLLKTYHPESYEVLKTVKLPWHASGNDGIQIGPDKLYPVIEENEQTGFLHRIRWNPEDRGVVPFSDEFSPLDWYDAASRWEHLLNATSSKWWFQLKPGTTLIFDNWRVLHGRSAFTGTRRICGGYINRDDYMSRWRSTVSENLGDAAKRFGPSEDIKLDRTGEVRPKEFTRSTFRRSIFNRNITGL